MDNKDDDRFDRLGGKDPAGGKARKGRRYTILFISEGGERVRSIKTTIGKLILIAILCILLIVGLFMSVLRGISERRGSADMILNEEMESLSEENRELREKIEILERTVEEAK
ncbi:MAG: hypothetical protein K6E34_01875 [Lachnospiraceae bacterium]|nr:hypothetical protein [Lachnospiraceae bacterium]